MSRPYSNRARDRRWLAEYLDGGRSMGELAEEAGVTRQTVQSALTRMSGRLVGRPKKEAVALARAKGRHRSVGGGRRGSSDLVRDGLILALIWLGDRPIDAARRIGLTKGAIAGAMWRLRAAGIEPQRQPRQLQLIPYAGKARP